MKKKLSFLSGLTAFTLLFAPFATSTYANTEEQAQEETQLPADSDLSFENAETQDVGQTSEESGTPSEEQASEENATPAEDQTSEGSAAPPGGYTPVFQPSVTDEVYHALAYLTTDQIDNYEIVLDYTEHKVPGLKVFFHNFSFSENAPTNIEMLLGENPNTVVTVKNGDTKVSFPIYLLDQESTVALELLPENNDKAVSDVYNVAFKRVFESGEELIKNLYTAVVMEFPIALDKVTNLENLEVYELDKSNNKVNLYLTYLDEKSVHTEFYTSGKYGVFEKVLEENNDSVGGSVTDEVYSVQDYVYFHKEMANEKGEIVLDYKSPNVTDTSVIFDPGKVKELLKENKNATAKVEMASLDVLMPLSLFDRTAPVQFTAKPSEQKVDGSLGTIYDFTLVDENGKKVSFKDNPITLKFVLDKTKVKNWDDLVLYYIENGKKAEKLPVQNYNKETGEVWAKVYHFSSYGVFEEAQVASTGTDKSNETSKNNNSSNEAGQSDSNKTVNDEQSGHALPNTATNSYNLLAFGLLFVVLGGVLLFVKIRKTA